MYPCTLNHVLPSGPFLMSQPPLCTHCVLIRTVYHERGIPVQPICHAIKVEVHLDQWDARVGVARDRVQHLAPVHPLLHHILYSAPDTFSLDYNLKLKKSHRSTNF